MHRGLWPVSPDQLEQDREWGLGVPCGDTELQHGLQLAGRPLQGIEHIWGLKPDLLVTGQLRGCVTRDVTQALCHHANILNYCRTRDQHVQFALGPTNYVAPSG